MSIVTTVMNTEGLSVAMPVVSVGKMRMDVRQRFVPVEVLMPLGQMEPQANGHQQGRHEEQRSDRVVQEEETEQLRS